MLQFRAGGTSEIEQKRCTIVQKQGCRKSGETYPKSDLDRILMSNRVPIVMEICFYVKKTMQRKLTGKPSPPQAKQVPTDGPQGSLIAFLARPLFQQ